MDFLKLLKTKIIILTSDMGHENGIYLSNGYAHKIKTFETCSPYMGMLSID